jgi:nucleoside-diphosphate-sugar epimerase
VEQLRGGGPCLVGGGEQNAGLVYVDHVVDIFVRAAERPEAVGRTYNACDDLSVTWKQYFTDLARLSGAPAPRSIPRFVARMAASAMECSYKLLRRTERPDITHEALNLIGSHHQVPGDKARRELGFKPSVSYEQALAAIAADIDERLGGKNGQAAE